METLFYYLAILQISVGLYLLFSGWQWLDYARRRLRRDPGFYLPRAAVICPCKGMEPELESNLRSLTEFEYKGYEVFFVLASANDPACPIVKRMAERSRVPAHVVIAEQARDCGEKVNNLRTVVHQLPEDFEVFVFADSDGRPGKSWLRHMIAPLNDAHVGAVTTMRWFIPARASLPNALLAAWNASVVTMLTEKGKNFCWGGGTAITRKAFEQIGVLDEWSHSVSDDYSMTRALQRANRTIVFAPECLTPSYINVDFHDLLAFTNRQILITRIYSGKTWLSGALIHLLYSSTFVLGVWLTLQNALAGLPDSFQLAVLTLAAMLLAAIRSGLRLSAVSEVLPTERTRITNQAAAYLVMGSFVPFLFILNFAASLFTRKIRWRGVTYELISPNQTRILAH